MPRAKEVKITKDGQDAFVLEESVKAWERHGWTRADDGSSEQSAETAPPVEGQTTRKAQ
jgi:hypothetical protein